MEFLTNQKTSTKGPEVLSRAVGARAMALGGAGVPNTNDASAVYWNPASLNNLSQSEVLFMHENGFTGERLDTLSLARPVWWKGRRRTWGAGLTYLSQNSFEVRVDDQSLGQASPYELVGSASYAQPWGPGALGITGKYVHQHLFSADARAFAFDVGAAFSGPWWRMGGTVVNVGTRLKGSGQSVGLPLAIKGGMAARVRSGARGQLWALLQMDAPADDRLVTHAGFEYNSKIAQSWQGALRGGYQQNGLAEGPSIGFGLRQEAWGINYAFQMQKDLGDAHRLDLIFRFGGPLAQEVQRETLLARAQTELNENRLLQARDTAGELKTLAPDDPAVRAFHQDLERRFSESIDPQTLFLQGFHSYNAEDFGKAADFFEKLVVVDPRYPEANDWLARSRAHVETARASRLKDEVDRAKEREWALLKAAAVRAESDGRWEDAAQAWRRGRDGASSAKEARDGLSRCRAALLDRSFQSEKRDDLDSALSDAKAALAVGGTERELANRVARLEKARVDRRRKDAQDKYTQGAEAYQAGEWQTAERLFREALTLAPDDQTIQRALDRLKAERKKP